jgi:hypothetical protein
LVGPGLPGTVFAAVGVVGVVFAAAVSAVTAFKGGAFFAGALTRGFPAAAAFVGALVAGALTGGFLAAAAFVGALVVVDALGGAADFFVAAGDFFTSARALVGAAAFGATGAFLTTTRFLGAASFFAAAAGLFAAPAAGPFAAPAAFLTVPACAFLVEAESAAPVVAFAGGCEAGTAGRGSPPAAVAPGDEPSPLAISAATVSGVGTPARCTKPGSASSTPRRNGSNACTTKARSSPLDRTSLALLGGGLPMADKGT